jgi:hypothetical protein
MATGGLGCCDAPGYSIWEVTVMGTVGMEVEPKKLSQVGMNTSELTRPASELATSRTESMIGV